VKDAADKFARAAILAELEGEKHLKEILDAAAGSATNAMASTFFLDSISRSIVDSHGGSLRMTKSASTGASFGFDLQTAGPKVNRHEK
jgi:K+-sensing histidine kinase KdpD